MPQSIITEKNFTFTLTKIPKNVGILSGGNYKDDEIELGIIIASDQINHLNFNFLFSKIPKSVPFWAIISVKIRNQETKFFIEIARELEEYEILENSYSSPFKKDDLLNGDVIIIYKITQVPAYICRLRNDNECVCYLNSSIQLLFHLSKFRSLVVSLRIQNRSFWIYQLYNLFTKMCSYTTSASTESLTQSFGWPPVARHIPHDATEFIEFLLKKFRKKLADEKTKSVFDAIFISRVIVNNHNPNKSEENVYQTLDQYVVNLALIPGSFQDRLNLTFENVRFLHFPEVLFISADEYYPSKDGLPKNLDLAHFADTNVNNLNHSKYTLSGLIIYIQRGKFVSHYTSFVRASSENVWLYFTDTSQTIYHWEYEPYIESTLDPLDYQIKSSIGKHQARVFMYIADDVLNEYFGFTQNVVPSKEFSSSIYDGPTREFLITTSSDIEEYVNSGHTDFRYVKSSLRFELPSNSKYSSVYQKVSELLNVPIESFILKGESSTGAPYYLTFQNTSKREINNFTTFSIHLYFYEFNNNNINSGKCSRLLESTNKCIPFHFVSFHFNQISFLHNLTLNLMHANNSRFLIQRSNSDSATKKPIQNNNNIINNNDDQLLERNCFRYLKSFVLYIDSTFKSIIPQLTKILNKPENTEIHLYVAEYEKNQKVGYAELDINKTIKQSFPQIMNGVYIYVQCVDDFKNSTCNDEIKFKFMFFKYAEKILNNRFYPKEIPNIFMLENFSIPVTFCKLTDPKKKSKTMLFPLRLPFENLTQLKKLICSFFDEKYPENGLMQLFYGFRKGLPPFSESVSSQSSIKKVIRILTFLLKNTKTKVISLCLAPQSNDSLNEMDSNSNLDSDTDYCPNIFIHYHIFNQFKKDDVSIRLYYSEDSISIKCLTQISIVKNTKISELASDLANIFSEYLSDDDKNILKNIKDNNLIFTDFYRIVRTFNGKFSCELAFDCPITSDMEIRFEKIPIFEKSNKLLGLIPVSYGAKYNNTNYTSTFGTPFYFPIYDDDLDDNEKPFTETKTFQRLSKMIRDIKKGEKFSIFVMKHNNGMIKTVQANDFKTILEKKLSYLICIKYINAATFIDEEKFFSNLRLLRK